MGETTSELKVLAVSVTLAISVAVIAIIGIAILEGFKNACTTVGSGNSSVTTCVVTNASVDPYITAIQVVGTFMTIIFLAIIGKVLIGMFRKGV